MPRQPTTSRNALLRRAAARVARLVEGPAEFRLDIIDGVPVPQDPAAEAMPDPADVSDDAMVGEADEGAGDGEESSLDVSSGSAYEPGSMPEDDTPVTDVSEDEVPVQAPDVPSDPDPESDSESDAASDAASNAASDAAADAESDDTDKGDSDMGALSDGEDPEDEEALDLANDYVDELEENDADYQPPEVRFVIFVTSIYSQKQFIYL